MSKVFKGLSWSFADNILQQIVNFTIGIILARLLSPEDFGVLGIISVFIAISNVFVNAGLSDALINKKDATDTDYSTVFWANIALGVLVFILLFIASPYIADYFQISELTNLIRITSLSVLFVSVSAVFRTILTKKIDFKTIALVSFISVAISGTVAVIMAYKGFGVLSLAVRMTLGQLLTLFLFVILNRWRPQLKFDIKSFKKMYSYAINIFFSRLLNVLYNNIYYFIIGKIFSPTMLGFYTRADSFKNLASTNITNTVQRVSFVILSNETDEIVRKKKFLVFFKGTAIITTFFMAILFSNALEIILILVGEKWRQSAIYLQILAVSGIFLPLYAVNTNFLAVVQKTKLLLKIEFLTKLFAIPIVIIGLVYGIEPMLYAIVVVSFLSYCISVIVLNKNEKHQYLDQVRVVLKIIFLFLYTVFSLQLVQHYLDIYNLYYLLFGSVVYEFVLFVIGVLLFFPEIKIKNLKK